ncbi:50S ribosomal protein L21 [bacterium]|nr:50S ribosomal protein L21 [bacterium]
MYCYADIKGFQFRVEPGGRIKVPTLNHEVGSKFEIADVKAYFDDNNALFGSDCSAYKAKATVLEHGKADKIIVFHKKRRKGFKRLRGHRQGYTLIQIDEITTAQEG